MVAKFEIYTDKGREYRFRLKAANGEIMLVSEGYLTKASCASGIISVKTNATIDARYERKVTLLENYMFNLKSSNGQSIATSETYETLSARDNAIESVKKIAPTAHTVVLV